MSPTRSLARPLLAASCVLGGASALRDPAPRVALAERAGLTDAGTLVRVNATVMLVGGLALGTGRLPRLSSLLLVGSMVPTTWVGHPFWVEREQAARKAQRVQFFKNVSMVGGLLLAAADTGGRESLPHAASRVSRRTRRRAAAAARSAQRAVSA